MPSRATASSIPANPLPLDTAQVELAIRAAAAEFDVSRRALRLAALLHLPRLATGDIVSAAAAEEEVQRLALQVKTRTAPHLDMSVAPSPAPSSVHALEFAAVDASTARVIEESFHYLGSARTDASAFGTYANGKLAALATASPLDLPPVIASLPTNVAVDRVRVISRVFAFDWAPPNTITHLLARVTAALKKTDGAKLLLTYLNPNLGFTGVSYRAANWSLYAREHGTRYAYLDRDYVPDRQLRERFGSADPMLLMGKLGERIGFSSISLAPLELYAFSADRHAFLPTGSPLELTRPQL